MGDKNKPKNTAWIIPIEDFNKIHLVLSGCNFQELLRNARRIEYDMDITPGNKNEKSPNLELKTDKWNSESRFKYDFSTKGG